MDQNLTDQILKTVVAKEQVLATSYKSLQERLCKKLLDSSKLVWNIKIGKKSVLKYYGEFMKLANTQ